VQVPADGVRSAAQDKEATDDDKVQAHNTKAAAATVLAISMLGHGGVNRLLAAGKGGSPRSLLYELQS
jgi:hypothetical protein